MRFDVLTLFPDMFNAVLGDSIVGRAQAAGLLEFNFVNIRDFSANKHKKTDDYPYSGGGGMLMTPQPIYDAYKSITADCEEKPHTIFMSPQGQVFNQKKAVELAGYDRLVFLCGHYEGVDQRVLDMLVDEEISVGDFVLTGGELPAMVVADCICRMVPGVLSDAACFEDESHWNGLLEYPQYSRPAQWHGLKVPEILRSGNHGAVDRWRRKQSILRTMHRRPDLFARLTLPHKTRAEKKFIAELEAEDDAFKHRNAKKLDRREQ